VPGKLIQLRRIGGIAWGLGLAGCASAGGGFDQLSAAEQAQFARCRQPVAEYVCAKKHDDALAACVQVQEASFGGRRTDKMRRSWLVQNGCPASVVDAPLVVSAPPAEPSPPPKSEPALPKEGGKSQEQVLTEQPDAPPIASADQESLLPAAAACARSAECESDLCVYGQCVELASLVGASAPRLVSGERADQQLRQSIVRQQADMQHCVERQLKDVDVEGRVTAASLQEADLTETSLESCLREQASPWRFPRTARGYTKP
jgi:hypothetical protein